MDSTQRDRRDALDGRVDRVRRAVLGALGVGGAGLLLAGRGRGAPTPDTAAGDGAPSTDRPNQVARTPVTRALDALEELERSLGQVVTALESVLDDLDAEAETLSGATTRMLDAVDRLERTVREVNDAARRDALTRADSREVARDGIEGAQARLDYALAFVADPGPDVAGELAAVEARLSAVEEEAEDALDQLEDAAQWTADRRQESTLNRAGRSVDRSFRVLRSAAEDADDGDPAGALRSLDRLRQEVAGHAAALRESVGSAGSGERRR
jgi:chromosome segregation ATPase